MYNYKYISTATTTIFAEKTTGILHTIVLTETAAGAITVSDAVGTIAVLKSSIVEGTYLLDVAYSKYLTVVTAAASKLTVSFK